MYNIKIEGKEIADKIAKLPYTVADDGIEAGIDYIIEYERIYPASQKGAPFKWTSDKQRRAYFASNGFGEGIPYTRRFRIRWGWKKEGKGRVAEAVNRVPYTKYVKLKKFQQIGHRLRGWTTIEQDVHERTHRILQAVDKGAKKAIKRLGL